ncbi:hypothetical protein DLM78_17535 [Leptospira stimsonii]|uniref:Uncharacterized protein n=1 Tax=Leptospira stimsonii TaxID=2202203 RepID=A0A8B3CN21_9LEPT|nr:hypothetical protein DLM78_17535 [Leptospira stimsonii]
MFQNEETFSTTTIDTETNWHRVFRNFSSRESSLFPLKKEGNFSPKDCSSKGKRGPKIFVSFFEMDLAEFYWRTDLKSGSTTIYKK